MSKIPLLGSIESNVSVGGNTTFNGFTFENIESIIWTATKCTCLLIAAFTARTFSEKLFEKYFDPEPKEIGEQMGISMKAMFDKMGVKAINQEHSQ